MINEITIENEFELATLMHEAWLSADSVACIADYYTTREVLSSLILISEGIFNLNEIDLHEDMDEEYLLVLDDIGLWVYYMEVNGRYMSYDHDVVFINNNCNSKVLTSNENKECDIIFFSKENEGYKCNGDCVNCDHFENEEINEESDKDDMKGFNFSFTNNNGTSTYSFYSSDYDLVEKMRKEISGIFKNN